MDTITHPVNPTPQEGGPGQDGMFRPGAIFMEAKMACSDREKETADQRRLASTSLAGGGCCVVIQTHIVYPYWKG